MSLDDEYTDYLTKPRKCRVCGWLAVQDKQTQDFFNRRGPDNAAKMTRFCQEKLDMDIKETTVRRHFRENHVA
ncbi:hypothetical protein [Mycolicibacterium sp. 018/SC-01/001]|uniref:hypothetical protein n=1 Tax=Mycolicibacterium sp. 018/SC-01/001 TaxID=2592069 RepID=UPI00117C7B66|nr:hypothetical protein [Mycolicibacterium sp. 018/SC-01/001]